MTNQLEPTPQLIEQQTLIGQIVEATLTALPGPLADALRVGTLTHWLSADLLTHLLDENVDFDQVRATLERFQWARVDSQGRLRYQEEIRRYLLAWWRTAEPDRFQRLHQAALAYFQVRRQTANESEQPTYTNEILYHCLLVDENAGIDQLINWFEDACARYQLGIAEQLVVQAKEVSEQLTEPGQMWITYFAARLDQLYRRADAGETTFRTLANRAPTTLLQAVAQWSLGTLLVQRQQWSTALHHYKASLHELQRVQAADYEIRVLLAMGDAYRDLAERSGGFAVDADHPLTLAEQLLRWVQILPFIIYKWLVHTLPFLPNWYFGTNYQDWIIAYLYTEAVRWYRRAESAMHHSPNSWSLVEVQVALAELEHRLGRWSSAWQRFALLVANPTVTNSLYRTARVKLGQGRALWAEGHLNKSAVLLAEALTDLERFDDQQGRGVITALLGRIYTDLRRMDEAIAVYGASLHAFGIINDRQAQTQVVWQLQQLIDGGKLSVPQQQKSMALIAQVTELQYISRFPDALLRYFRWLAFCVVLPLNYWVTLLVSERAMDNLFVVIEGELRLLVIGANLQTSTSDIFEIAVYAASPFFLLWFYHFTYSFLGFVVAYILGRLLLPIERDPPRQITLNSQGLTVEDDSQAVGQTIPWADVSTFISNDYYQWRQPIYLFSRSALVNHSNGVTLINAITSGYSHLKRQVEHFLMQKELPVHKQSLDIRIFDWGWILGVLLFALALTSYANYIEPLSSSWGVYSTGIYVDVTITLWIQEIMLIALRVFPATVLWRLLAHHRIVRITLGREAEIIPKWVLWFAAILQTWFALDWILADWL